MIKPLNISSLNTSKELSYECSKGRKGIIYLKNSLINVDDEYNAIGGLSGYNCPVCNEGL